MSSAVTPTAAGTQSVTGKFVERYPDSGMFEVKLSAPVTIKAANGSFTTSDIFVTNAPTALQGSDLQALEGLGQTTWSLPSAALNVEQTENSAQMPITVVNWDMKTAATDKVLAEKIPGYERPPNTGPM